MIDAYNKRLIGQAVAIAHALNHAISIQLSYGEVEEWDVVWPEDNALFRFSGPEGGTVWFPFSSLETMTVETDTDGSISTVNFLDEDGECQVLELTEGYDAKR